jgi:hypothetical protein
MNERIAELWDKAAEDTMDDSWQSQTKFMERFAELIVQECSQYIEDKFDFCGDELIIAEKLKEHFGVES